MANRHHNDEICMANIWLLIISFFLIGYYVKNCVNEENPEEEYCHKMFIATIFFSTVTLALPACFIICVIFMSFYVVFCKTNEEGTLYSIVYCIDSKNFIGHNLYMFFSEFCCCCLKKIPIEEPIEELAKDPAKNPV